MKLLLLGRSLQTRSLSELIGAAGHHTITICTRNADVLEAAGSVDEHFDWIILEGRATSGEGAALARKLRAMGNTAPIAFISFADEDVEYQGERPPTLVCAVERSTQSSRVIGCTLTKADVDPGQPTGTSTLAKILFEYQAPCKRGEKGAA